MGKEEGQRGEEEGRRLHYTLSTFAVYERGFESCSGSRFFPVRKTGVCYGYGAGVALGSQKQSIHA